MTPPSIISTYPDSSSRFNFNDKKLRFEFDRYVDERSFEESIFISPHLGTLEFDWSGTEVEITFSERLRTNTTYVVNIGTDVVDKYRGGQRMTKAYTLAFSTGPTIDRGGIEGVVYPLKKSDETAGVMIFAYQLDGIKADTLNPATSKPDFITQTGKGGSFFLHYIPFGNYRLFAIRDEFRNLIYDRETDEYGIPSSNICISSVDTMAKGILMQLAKEDTTGPRLIKAIALDQNHVLAEFSEPLRPASLIPSAITVIDTMSKLPLEVISIFPRPTQLDMITVITSKQDSAKPYVLIVKNVTDSVGNNISPIANTFPFEGVSRKDTSYFSVLSASIKDSVQNTDLRPRLTILFSDAVAKNTSLDCINIYDSTKQVVSVEKKRVSDILISVEPIQDLQSKYWYALKADFSQVKDWSGRLSRDSIKSWRFETLDVEEMSSIDGMVIDSNMIDREGPLYVTATKMEGKETRASLAPVNASGKFRFPVMPEGLYVFQAFRDRNKNGKYDFGKPFPFVFSERMSTFTDTLKVRARWPLEGVQVRLK